MNQDRQTMLQTLDDTARAELLIRLTQLMASPTSAKVTMERTGNSMRYTITSDDRRERIVYTLNEKHVLTLDLAKARRWK